MIDKLTYIKKSWQSINSDDLKNDISKKEIAKLLRKKSKAQLDRIKYTFIVECCIGIPLLVLMAIYSPQISSYPVYFNIFMLIVIVALIIPTLKIFRIGKFQDQTTIEYLKKFTATIDYILKAYLLIMKYIFIFTGFIIIIVGALSNFDEMKKIQLFILILIVFCSLIFTSTYFLVRYYYKARYQKPNDKLKLILEELEENENQKTISE